MNIKKIILLFATFVAIVFNQNCGNVDITESSSKSVLSVTSSMVINMEPNNTKIIDIEPEPDSLPIENISFTKGSQNLSIRTLMEGELEIQNPSNNQFSYTPVYRFQGYDYGEIFVSDRASNIKKITLIFVVKDKIEGLLPEANFLIYGPEDAEEMQDKLDAVPPPTQEEIFNTWSRFSSNKFYEAGDTIPTGDESLSWSFENTPDRVVCNVNSSNYTGFISNKEYNYYSHSAILTSRDRDDDLISIIIAFKRVNGDNHSLEAVRTQGGWIGAQLGWSIRYSINGTSQSVFGEKSVGGVNQNSAGDGWSNRKSLVFVLREGDVIKAKASEWQINESSLELSDDSMIILNLDDHPELHIFKGPQKYGYGSHSQRYTTFLDVEFNTGVSDRYIYDLANNTVFEKLNDGTYIRRVGTGVYDHVGTPRRVRNPDTGKTFLLNENKSFEETL